MDGRAPVGTLHVAVRGRVQGVGFRYYVRERARSLHVVGWVRNLPDGSVEILARGNDAALERLRAALRAGPPGARVESVDDRREEPHADPLDPFGIVR